MKQLEYDDAEVLRVAGNSIELRAHSVYRGFFGPLEAIADISLVSFRNAAARYAKTTSDGYLELRWTDEPTAVFEQGDPSPNLVWLKSDGREVVLCVGLSLDRGDRYPESDKEVKALISKLISPILPQYDAQIESIDVEPLVLGQSRFADAFLRIPPQRRTIGEANHFGESVEDFFERRGSHALDSPKGVIDVLRYAPALLVGQPESTWLEAKRQPYNLDLEIQRLELAKDVAAMANANGGIIVFGCSTKTVDGHDLISRVGNFDTAALSSQRYMQILRSRIFPMPARLTISTVGRGVSGLGYIHIPRQPEELRPFFLKSSKSKGGIKSTSLTMPVRVGASVEYDSPEAIHSLIVAGRAALRSQSST